MSSTAGYIQTISNGDRQMNGASQKQIKFATARRDAQIAAIDEAIAYRTNMSVSKREAAQAQRSAQIEFLNAYRDAFINCNEASDIIEAAQPHFDTYEMSATYFVMIGDTESALKLLPATGAQSVRVITDKWTRGLTMPASAEFAAQYRNQR